MAKIKVSGAAAVVVSDVRLEDYQKVEKYRPERLVLKDEDGSPYFKVNIGTGVGSIGKYGATFGDVTDGAAKHATITIIADNGFGEDAKATVTEKVGVSILNLNKIEGQMPEVIREIDAELANIAASIELA